MSHAARLARECEICDNGKMKGHEVCSKECGKKLIARQLEYQKIYQDKADSYGRYAAELTKLYGDENGNKLTDEKGS